jgi:putative oxidoreductase
LANVPVSQTNAISAHIASFGNHLPEHLSNNYNIPSPFPVDFCRSNPGEPSMLRLLFPPFLAGRAAVGMFVLRLVAGTAMAFHGWPKIQNPTAWMGPDSDVPGILQALAAIAEFGGGICWVLGLVMPLASFLIACTMAVAAGMVHIPAGHPFVAKGGGPSLEPAFGYLAIAIAMLLVGPGRLSLDWVLFGKSQRSALPPDASQR